MNVQATRGATGASALHGTAAAAPMRAADGPQRPSAGEARSPGADEHVRPSGAVRLAEADRFKGAADVRLRLSLQEELRAIHTDAIRSDVQEKVTGVAERFVELADSLVRPDMHTLERGEAFALALVGFEDVAAKSIAVYDPFAEDGAQGLKQDLQAAFDALYGEVSRIFSQADGAAPGAGGASEGEEAWQFQREIPSELAQFMTALVATFSETVQEMGEQAAGTGAPPEVAGPEEAGPYERLAAEYGRLRPQAAQPSEHVDVQA